MKTFAIGDIHGAYKAMIQCFERSKFDYKKDRLTTAYHSRRFTQAVRIR